MIRLSYFSVVLVIVLFVHNAAACTATIGFRIIHAYNNVWAKVNPSQEPEGTPIIVDGRHLYGYQRWYLTIIDNGEYANILNDASGLLAASRAESGSHVVVVNEADDGSKWRFDPITRSQHHFIIRLQDSNLVWTLDNDRVALRPNEQNEAQQWELLDDDDVLCR